MSTTDQLNSKTNHLINNLINDGDLANSVSHVIANLVLVI